VLDNALQKKLRHILTYGDIAAQLTIALGRLRTTRCFHFLTENYEIAVVQ